MFKIVITGPESTGKSTLTNQIAVHYKALSIDEFARAYLSNLGRDYTKKDLTEIAKGQIEIEDKAMKKGLKFVICDTSLEVIKIWSEFKYKSCDSFITISLQQRQPDLYLLLQPDFPWVPDPLRENPNDRDALFELYKRELTSSKVPFYDIFGNGEKRFEMAKEVINNHLL